MSRIPSHAIGFIFCLCAYAFAPPLRTLYVAQWEPWAFCLVSFARDNQRYSNPCEDLSLQHHTSLLSTTNLYTSAPSRSLAAGSIKRAARQKRGWRKQQIGRASCRERVSIS